jgi:hypothetical protein
LPADLSTLPPAERLLAEDRVAPEAGLDCVALAAELERNRGEMIGRENAIQGRRDQNQAIGYAASVVFPPLLLAAEHSSADKAQLDALQQRRDRPMRLSASKGCPPG